MEATKRKHYIYGHVFESLTAGLYPNRREILREYIQNAYDAVISARAEGTPNSNLIRVQTDGDNLYIHDNGIGMGEEAIEEYRYFGYSKKSMDRNVGFRGIGKLAGLAVANSMVVVSKEKGSRHAYRYKCEAQEMLEAVRIAKESGKNLPLEALIEEYSSISSFDSPIDEHFTAVELYGIRNDEGDLTDPVQVGRYLAAIAPVPFDNDRFRHAKSIQDEMRTYLPKYEPVHMLVNGAPVYKPYTDDLPLEGLRFIEIPSKEGPRAFCWYMSHKHSRQIDSTYPRGLTYRCKGFAVGDETLVRNSIFSAGRAGMVYWYAGEIHILDPGLIPSASRTDFEDTPARRDLYEAAREAIAKPLNSFANQRSTISSLEKETVKASASVEAISSKLRTKAVAPEVKATTIEQLQATKERLLKKANMIHDPQKRGEALKTVRTIEAVTQSLNKGEGVVDVRETLGLLTDDAFTIYTVIMQEVTRWFNMNAADQLGTFVESVHAALKRRA